MKYVYFVFVILFLLNTTFWLKITEVYFKGSNEFIELYNDSENNFSWNITFSWAKKSSFDLDLNLSWKSTIVLWDDLSEYISWNVNYISWLKINLTDTEAINIKILGNGQVLDSFFVSQNEVKKVSNKKASFEKIFSWNDEIIKLVETAKNAKNWYLINPAYVHIIKSSWWNSIFCKINMSKQNDLYKFSFTWNTDFQNITWYIDNNFELTWQNMSKTLSTWNYIIKWKWTYSSWNICSSYYGIFIDKQNIVQSKNIFTWSLQIKEVYPKNDNFPEYVELQAVWNISWNYILDGFARWSTKLNLNLTLYSGNFIVLAKSYSWFLYTWNILLFDKLSLSDVGEQLSISQDGHIIDNVKYTKWNTLYYTKTENNIRQFETDSIPTPWFSLYVKDYFKTKKEEKTNCSIILQSYDAKDDKLKINFDTKIDDEKYCKDNYKQIWTYSGGQVTWTCNPYNFYLDKKTQVVNFEIRDFSWNTICKDDYNIFYEKEDNKQENLNCFIKIQTKTTPFLAKDSINFITIVNGKEIQNSNTNYTCTYSLSWQTLSNKCNPDSLKLDWKLHKIDLNVLSKNWQTCQTTYYLNLPSENTKIVGSTRTITPIDCSKMSSTKLNQLVKFVNSKYKSKYTLKKVFDPIKYLYIDTTPLIDKCLNQNSTQLKELVIKIRKKYKSKYTLNKIFWRTRQNIETTWWIKIYKILAKDKIIFTGQYMSWLYIQIWKRKYSLHNNIFTWYKKSNWCISLFKNDFLLDSKCLVYWKMYYTDTILFIKDKIIYSDNGQLILKDNVSFQKLVKRIKKAIPHILKIYKKLKKQKLKYKKLYVKESKNAIKYSWKYYKLNQKYKKLKLEFKDYKSKKYDKLKEKNKYIKSLKKKISFLKKFIVSVKKYIDKDIYQDYLKNYRKLK